MSAIIGVPCERCGRECADPLLLIYDDATDTLICGPCDALEGAQSEEDRLRADNLPPARVAVNSGNPVLAAYGRNYGRRPARRSIPPAVTLGFRPKRETRQRERARV